MLIPIKINSTLNENDFIVSKVTLAVNFAADEHQMAI
jgi:hypothetical protein